MANDKRGEIEIELDGKEYLLRPTFNSMCVVEKKLGRSIMDIAIDVSRISHVEAATIIREFIFVKEGEEMPSLNSIGAGIMKEGMIEIVRKMDSIIGITLGGSKKKDEDSSGEPTNPKE